MLTVVANVTSVVPYYNIQTGFATGLSKFESFVFGSRCAYERNPPASHPASHSTIMKNPPAGSHFGWKGDFVPCRAL